ncbi:rhoptry neck protein RON4 [Toxoplasma gondii MAS]|uniref:Rhoptry neck protein RON4 n=1 Tax=Toxoplasma gondii MAS TaxID=943118 RepID=A0A086PKV9_TOXGO|nr:rhoptry neck protein RON4 [Toxoplasma gondii MAS]
MAIKNTLTGSGLLVLLTLACGTTVQSSPPTPAPRMYPNMNERPLSAESRLTPGTYRSELHIDLKSPQKTASQSSLAPTGDNNSKVESIIAGSDTTPRSAEGTSESPPVPQLGTPPRPAPRRSKGEGESQPPTAAPRTSRSVDTGSGSDASTEQQAGGQKVVTPIPASKGIYPSLDELRRSQESNVDAGSGTSTNEGGGTSEGPQVPQSGTPPRTGRRRAKARNRKRHPTPASHESSSEDENQPPTTASRPSNGEGESQPPTAAPRTSRSVDTGSGSDASTEQQAGGQKVVTPIPASKGIYPNLDELRQTQEGEESASQPADVTWFSMSVPMGVVDRRVSRALKEQFFQFLQHLSADYPKQVQTVYEFLGWVADKLPENEEEVQMFIDALNTTEAMVGKAARWIFKAIPERERETIYSSFYQMFRDKLPKKFFETAEGMNPDVGQYFSAEEPVAVTPEIPAKSEEDSEAAETPTPLRRQANVAAQVLHPLPAKGVTRREWIPWPKMQNAISKAHGPLTRVPEWTPVTGSCALGDGYTDIDVTKATTDVLFRITLLILQQIRRKKTERGKLEDDQALVALCSAAGAFVDAWQHQQQALILEDPGTPKAHAQLIERLRNAGKYFMKSYDETTGESDHQQWKKNKAEVSKLGKSALMKSCVKYIKASGDVATRPFDSGTAKYPSRSLYGGIANTLETPFADSEAVAKAVHDYAKEHKKPEKLVGLCGALQISGYFKKCFSDAGRLSSVSFFHQHVDGASVLVRTLARERPIGRHALSQAICDPNISAQYFEGAFRLFSSTVSQEWEKENLFAQLASWTGKEMVLAPSLEEQAAVPPAQPAYETVYGDEEDRIYRIHVSGRHSSPQEVLYVGGIPSTVKPQQVHVLGPTVSDESRRVIHPVRHRSRTAPSSEAASAAAESSDEDPLPAENATAFLGVTPQEEESDAYKHTLDFDAVSPRKNKNKENRISAPLKQSDTLIEESTSKTSEL